MSGQRQNSPYAISSSDDDDGGDTSHAGIGSTAGPSQSSPLTRQRSRTSVNQPGNVQRRPAPVPSTNSQAPEDINALGLSFLSNPLTDANTRTSRIGPPQTHNMPASITAPTALQQALLELMQHDEANSYEGTRTAVPAVTISRLGRAILQVSDDNPASMVPHALRALADAEIASGGSGSHWLRWLRGYELGAHLTTASQRHLNELRQELAHFADGFTYENAAHLENVYGGIVDVDYSDMISFIRDSVQPGWLTGATIDAGLTAYVTQRWHQSGGVRDRSREPVVIPNHMSQSLARNEPTPRLNGFATFSGDIYVPVNRVGQHWLLLVLRRAQRQVLILNSMRNNADRQLGQTIADRIISRLHLGDNWTTLPDQGPTQNDIHSCGLFVLENAAAMIETGSPTTCSVNLATRVRWMRLIHAVVALSRQARNRGWAQSSHGGLGILPAPRTPTSSALTSSAPATAAQPLMIDDDDDDDDTGTSPFNPGLLVTPTPIGTSGRSLGPSGPSGPSRRNSGQSGPSGQASSSGPSNSRGRNSRSSRGPGANNRGTRSSTRNNSAAAAGSGSGSATTANTPNNATTRRAGNSGRRQNTRQNTTTANDPTNINNPSNWD